MCDDQDYLRALVEQCERVAQTTPPDSPEYAACQANLGTSLGLCYEQASVATDLEGAIACLERAAQATLPSSPDYAPYQTNLGKAFGLRYALSGAGTDLDAVIVCMGRAAHNTLPDNIAYGTYQTLLGVSLLWRYHERSREEADLRDAVACLERAIHVTLPDSPEYALRHAALGKALLACHEWGGMDVDLDAAITCLERTVEATPPDNHTFIECQIDLGGALLRRYMRREASVDLEGAIAHLEQAVHVIAPDSPAYFADCGTNLGLALLQRYEREGTDSDLERAIAVLEQTMARSAPTAANQNNLGGAFLKRYTRWGRDADLERALAYLERAVGLMMPGRPDYALCQNGLGVALLQCYERWGRDGDLERAITYLESAALTIAPDSAGHALCQNGLGTALLQRHTRWGRDGDLEQAIACLERAVELTIPSSIDHAMYQANLSVALLQRYEWEGTDVDLEATIVCLERATQMTPPGSPHYAPYQTNLGMALLRRYERGGLDVDLDRAVACLEGAVSGMPLDSLCQANLGTALLRRYERRGLDVDLDCAIDAHERAVQAAPPGSPTLAECQHGLGTTLLRRYERGGLDADLDRAIACLEGAMSGVPLDSPHHALCQANLGFVLLRRYERRGDNVDLDRAITSLERAMQGMAPNNPHLAVCGASLGGALCRRYERTTLGTDLDQAVAVLEKAVHLMPPTSPALVGCQTNLGIVLLRRYERRGLDADLDEAITCYKAAVKTTTAHGSLHMQWQAHDRLARVLESNGRLTEALDAALGAIYRIAALAGALPEDQSLTYLHIADAAFAHALRLALRLTARAQDMGDDAVAEGYRERAFRIAEMSKGRWFVALLAAREQALPGTPGEDPILVTELTRLRRVLAQVYHKEEGSHLDSRNPVPFSPVSTTTSNAQRDEIRELERAYLATVQRLRAAYPELTALSTVAPQDAATVQQALPTDTVLLELVPLHESIVIFVLTRERLLVDQAPLTAGRLRDLTASVLPAVPREAPSVPARQALEDALAALGRDLWPTLAPLIEQVCPGWQTPLADDAVPHLVVVPTGDLHRWPLHLLPLPDGSGQVLDRFAISYGATADTPHYCLRHPVSDMPTLLALAPSADLPFSILEARAAQALAPGLAVRQGSTATVEGLRAAAGSARWIALATHAQGGSAEDPVGRVLLHDGDRCVWVRPHELIARLRLRAEHMSLTACLAHGTNPAAGDNLVGLTRALLYAGCRSLLTTLWAIDDAEAAVLDHAFWDLFLTTGQSADRCLRAVLRARRDGGLDWLAERGSRMLERLSDLPHADVADLEGLMGRVEQWELEARLQATGGVIREAGALDAGAKEPVERAGTWCAFLLYGAAFTRASAPDAGSATAGCARAAQYLALAETAAMQRFGLDMRRQFAEVERQHDDIHAALAQAQQEGQIETGLRLAAALWRFWAACGYVDEGRRWLEAWLSMPGAEAIDPTVRATALHGAGVLAFRCGDRSMAEQWVAEALAIRRGLGDGGGIAASLMNMGNIALAQGDNTRAIALFEESVTLWRTAGDHWGQAMALNNLAQVARAGGDDTRAAELLEESVSLRRVVGDQEGVATGLAHLGRVHLERGDVAQGETCYTESLTHCRGLGDQRGQATALDGLARAELLTGNLMGARTRWIEALTINQHISDRAGLVTTLEGLAAVACRTHEPLHGVHLYAAAQAVREVIGVRPMRAIRAKREDDLAAARREVGWNGVSSAWETGRTLSAAQIVALARRISDRPVE